MTRTRIATILTLSLIVEVALSFGFKTLRVTPTEL